jgi:hypothetical protein
MSRNMRARRPGRPLYFHVERLVRPGTGEEVGALVPAYPCDRKEMKARKYSIGTTIRGLLTKPRNEKFHRKAHALGQLAVEHIEGFEQLNAHDALKRLQREAGVQCEGFEIDLGPLGIVTAKQPRSLAFDEMDESEFAELWEGVIAHIRAKYWPSLGDDAIEQFALMQEGSNA